MTSNASDTYAIAPGVKDQSSSTSSSTRPAAVATPPSLHSIPQGQDDHGAATTSAMSLSSAEKTRDPSIDVNAAHSASSSPNAASRAKGSVAALMARFQSSPVPSPPAAATPRSAKLSVITPTKSFSGNSLSSPAATEEEVAEAIEPPFMAASEGAVSLTEPDATIENPFRSSRPQTPEIEPVVFSPPLASSSPRHPTISAGRSSPTTILTGWSPEPLSLTTTDQAEASSSQAATQSTSPTFNRFSSVSLSSTADREEGQTQKASSPLCGGASSPPFASKATSSRRINHSSSTSYPESEQTLNRAGEVDSERSSAVGMEMLKENFEKMQRHSKRHARGGSEVMQKALIGEEVARRSQDFSQTPKISLDEEREEADGVDWDFWGEVMNNYQEVAHQNPHKLSQAIQVGIPSQLRGLCWQLLSASKDPELELIYAWYIRQKTSPHEKQIRKDLNRTFPEQEYFKDGRVGQENLYNVVKAYSLYDEEVGYVQGMGFIVGPLLLNMPDEEAFSTLSRLMKAYDLRSHFLPNMPGLQLRLFQFDRLLEDMLPLLHRHLTRQGVKTSHYATQWFMTLFSYRFPLDFVYRVLDSIFAEGIEAIFRFAMALMTGAEDDLLSLNFEQALAYLKDTTICGRYKLSDGGYDVNSFARDAYAVQIHSTSLDGYAAEFEESVKAVTAHRRELEAARIVNRNLAAKVAELEDQLEKIQGEHVDLVKEAVLNKVAKEETEEELIRYKMLYAELVLQADQAGSNENIRISRQSSVQSPSTRGSTGNMSNGVAE